MFKLFVFAAILAFAAATADPGLITSYSRPGYIAPAYNAYAAPSLALTNPYYNGYASPYAYNAYSSYSLPYAYRY